MSSIDFNNGLVVGMLIGNTKVHSNTDHTISLNTAPFIELEYIVQLSSNVEEFNMSSLATVSGLVEV